MLSLINLINKILEPKKVLDSRKTQKMSFNEKYLILAVSLCLLFLGLSVVGWFTLGGVTLIFSRTFMLGLLLLTQLLIYHRIQKAFHQQNNNYRQVESLFSIFSILKINKVLPPMRNWVISPDFGTIIISLIYEQKPKLILEASSGVSTLLAAYCLKEIGEGTVLSVEHQETYANISMNNVKKHGLEDIATVIHAPLKKVTIGDKKWRWYDTERLDKLSSLIDMVIVDGPGYLEQKLARYPALPILFKYLSDKATIILDDADRKDEKEIVSLWEKEFNSFEVEIVSNEKGAVILRRKTD